MITPGQRESRLITEDEACRWYVSGEPAKAAAQRLGTRAFRIDTDRYPSESALKPEFILMEPGLGAAVLTLTGFICRRLRILRSSGQEGTGYQQSQPPALSQILGSAQGPSSAFFPTPLTGPWAPPASRVSGIKGLHHHTCLNFCNICIGTQTFSSVWCCTPTVPVL